MNLKQMLEIVSPALGGDQSTQVGACMVQVFEERMWAYGGEFCISVPCSLDLSVAFHPKQVRNFFATERGAAVFKVENNKLVIREGKDHVKVPIIDKNDVTTLAVFGELTPAALDRDNLKFCASLVEPEGYHQFSRSVTFREGAMWAGTGSAIFCGYSGIPKSVEPFAIMKDSAKSLAAQKSPLVGIVIDPLTEYAVEFHFKDGVRIACRRTEVDTVSLSPLFQYAVTGEGEIDTESLEKLMGITCDRWNMGHDALSYRASSGDSRIEDSEGAIATKTGLDPKTFPKGIMVSDTLFKRGLALSGGKFRVHARGFYFKAPKGVYATAMMAPQPEPVQQPKDKGGDRPAWNGEDSDEVPF